MTEPLEYDQYFLSYSGIDLPLNLVSPISKAELQNRNTYFGVNLDGQGRISLIHKRVYGDIELSHHYGYEKNGILQWATIHGSDGDGRKLYFDADGAIMAEEDCHET